MRQQILGLGGVTNLQASNETILGCLPLAENGILGCLTLKTSMKLFTVCDILLGVIYLLYLVNEVLLEWTMYNIGGPFYFLTLLYFLRVASLPVGLIGFVAVHKKDLDQGVLLAKAYFNLVRVEAFLFPLVGILATYDMCRSYLFFENCKHIGLWNVSINVVRFCYLFYVAYITKSYYRRLQRGERILVECGRSIVELINQVQMNSNNASGSS